MPVIVSRHLTAPACQEGAAQLAGQWSTLLKSNGRNGYYCIGHGHDYSCAQAHLDAYDDHLWIFTSDPSGVQTHGCQSFLSTHGNPLSYVGAGHVDAARINKQWSGTCGCGGNHP